MRSIVVGPSVCTILLSYNRPKMLLEAVKATREADELIVLDDGSDFDVEKVIGAELNRFPKVSIKVSKKMTVEERLGTPRLGKSINAAIRESSCEVITYLCDDDLFHEDWINHVRVFFSGSEDHVVRGKWGIFKDWDKPGEDLCPLKPDVDMTTGNFAHLRSCSVDHGMFWSEVVTAVHDSWFIRNAMLPRHPLASICKLDVLAGWRRDHAYNMMNFTNGAACYTGGAAAALSRKTLE